jgi:hypothetical protein
MKINITILELTMTTTTTSLSSSLAAVARTTSSSSSPGARPTIINSDNGSNNYTY